MSCQRGTSNSNARGSAENRRRRREWLVKTYRANRDACEHLILLDLSPPHNQGYEPQCWTCGYPVEPDEESGPPPGLPINEGVPACRCYRCGDLLTVDTVTVDRIIPGCRGGTYRRDNIRPCCAGCNSETGGATRSKPTVVQLARVA